jgi:hypothetical protein
MEISLLLAIQAVVLLIVGAAFLLIPRQYTAPFGMHLDEGSVFFARLVGSAYLAIGVLDWLTREHLPANLDAVILGNLIVNALPGVLHLRAVLTGLHDRLGWGPVALIAALTIAWVLAWLS